MSYLSLMPPVRRPSLVVDAAQSQEITVHQLGCVGHMLTEDRIPNEVAHAVDNVAQPELKPLNVPLSL
jgi:hypothetical protein